MKLISNKALREFAERHPAATKPLQDFRMIIEKAAFANYAQLWATFPTADKVGELHVFNIGGNKFRLIAWIHFESQRFFVKAVLTHSEYDKGAWK
jgi:mRNA interferase HigB